MTADIHLHVLTCLLWGQDRHLRKVRPPSLHNTFLYRFYKLQPTDRENAAVRAEDEEQHPKPTEARKCHKECQCVCANNAKLPSHWEFVLIHRAGELSAVSDYEQIRGQECFTYTPQSQSTSARIPVVLKSEWHAVTGEEKQHMDGNQTSSYLIFGKVWSYGIEFRCWHWRWRLVEKIVCPIYWQQSLWASRETGSVSLTPGAVRFWSLASLDLLQLSHYQTKRNVRREQSALGIQNPTLIITNRYSLLIWQWTITANLSSFSFWLKEHSTISTYVFALQIEYYTGGSLVWLRFYWLKEMLLSLLLDIAIFRCAGRSCWEK